MILHLSLFKTDPDGNGAERRTAQIAALLALTPFNIIKRENAASDHFFVNPLIKVFTGWKYRKWIPAKYRSLKKFLEVGYQIKRIHRFINDLPEKPTFIVWEASRKSDPFLPVILAELNFKVIVLPHNLESLCYGQSSLLTGAKQGDWLCEELAFLSQCSAGFAISREEQWLLNSNGLKTGYLPFFPSDNHLERFRSIRLNRLNRTPENLMVTLGSADNNPTAAGMVLLMNLVAEMNLEMNLVVTGFNTTRLLTSPSASHPRISVTGTLSNEDLDSLLARCKAVVLHQEIAAGALTKIPELLLAGIPVIANETAARSWFGTPGIQVYRKIEEIPLLIGSVLPVVPEPLPPENEYHFFVESVMNLMKESE